MSAKHTLLVDSESKTQLLKKCRVFDEAISDICCPITKELPIDPVVAEDGRIYERCAIETHMYQCQNGVRSPVTNESMGCMVSPVHSVANLIRALIACGVIEETMANKWNMMVDAKSKADRGDVGAMYLLATFLDQHGMFFAARSWYFKGAVADDTKCMACLGYSFVRMDCPLSREVSMYLGMAAERGSDVAVYWLGKAYFVGVMGSHMGCSMEVNTRHTSQAKKWLGKFLDGNCTIEHFSCYDVHQAAIEDARQSMSMLECTQCNSSAVRRFCPHVSRDRDNLDSEEESEDAGEMSYGPYHGVRGRVHDGNMLDIDVRLGYSREVEVTTPEYVPT